ncbi:rhodanese-like domain-containing protein [Sandaracinus amylolyticus]|nr:rhodanese-like domain-containing protein [Sandaracinus amylolyticus]
MTRRVAILAAALVVMLAAGVALIPGCGLDVVHAVLVSQHPRVRWISTEELARELESESPPLVIDVRSDDEIAVSTIPGAQSMRELPTDRDVVVYCSVGARSAVVAERFPNARNLRGGIFAWANESRPLVRDGARTNEVHPYDSLWRMLLSARVVRASGGS